LARVVFHVMKLFFDHRDDRVLEQRGIPLIYWLDDLGAQPLDEAIVVDEGFRFAGARPIEDYCRLVSGRHRRPSEPDRLVDNCQTNLVTSARAWQKTARSRAIRGRSRCGEFGVYRS
jgi:hypothetical protein